MKKVLLIIGVIVVVIIVIGVVAGTGEESSTTETSKDNQQTQEKKVRFEGRADAQDNDTELLVNESAEIKGMKIIATKVDRKTRLGEFQEADSGKEYVIVTISLENVSDEAIPYNEYDFRIQTSGGQVLDPAFAVSEGGLDSGDLIGGGKISGTVTFEPPKEQGHQYLIYKPSAWSSDRVIVQIQ
jgi:hypothetical protein